MIARKRKLVSDDVAAEPRVTIIIPVRDEGEAIVRWLDLVFEAVELRCEVLAVFDSADDSTRAPLEAYAAHEPRLRPILNDVGIGPARAVRAGIQLANSPVVVVTMGDGSDDPRQIDELTHLVERGVVVASASRYMRGGQMVGGPLIKRILSKLAGRSLHQLARVGTNDATNCFKAFSRSFMLDVGVHSDHGFEIGIELVAKARRARLPVAEIPTIWLDRVNGRSKFKLAPWIPYYLRWYLFAFGPARSVTDIRTTAEKRRFPVSVFPKS